MRSQEVPCRRWHFGHTFERDSHTKALLPPGDTWPVCRHFWLSQSAGRWYGRVVGEGRGAAQHRRAHRTARAQRMIQPQMSRAPWLRDPALTGPPSFPPRPHLALCAQGISHAIFLRTGVALASSDPQEGMGGQSEPTVPSRHLLNPSLAFSTRKPPGFLFLPAAAVDSGMQGDCNNHLSKTSLGEICCE